MSRAPERSVAAFDSALGLVSVLGAALHGRDLPRLGQSRPAAAGVRVAGALPLPLRRAAYARAGAGESIPERALTDVDLGAVAGYVTEHYPDRRYPGVLVGGANGGLTHLAAAAQVPWLPQTVLVPVRWSANDPRRPDRALAWGARAAEPLLARNPDIELHHMHDAAQDELMVGQMAYFRCKWTRLPAAYERFLAERLQPGAPVVMVRNRLRWPVTRVAERHVFQNGAYGGQGPEDYARRAHAPHADADAAEAEWGTTGSLEHAVRGWAEAHGHPVHVVDAEDPQDLAVRAADRALAWRRAQGVQVPRVVVDQFIATQPWHVLRSGAVPFWTVFPVEHCARAAARWLAERGPFDQVDVALFDHGVSSPGMAPVEQWRELTQAGTTPGRLLGQRADRYPADFAALARLTPAMRRLPDGPPWRTLTLEELCRV